MFSKVASSAVVGIEAYGVEVEVDIANGLPAFSIVGLPDAACRESQDRVRAAIAAEVVGVAQRLSAPRITRSPP